jgi:hypothetical protein
VKTIRDRRTHARPCMRPGCTATFVRPEFYRRLPPYCSHPCQRLAVGFPVTDRVWTDRRLRDCDLDRDGSGFTLDDLTDLRARYRRTGNVGPVRPSVVESPSNNIHHRRIRDEQLRLIAAALEASRPTLRKVV